MKNVTKYLLLFIFMLGIRNAFAIEVSGVKVPPLQNLEGHSLQLNGAGLRTVYVIRVKVYVAALYSAIPLRSSEDVFSSTSPLRFDFTFLRDVGKEKVQDAWSWQFKESGSYSYSGLERDTAAFVQAFGALKKGGVETVIINGNETSVIDQGEEKVKIMGRDFQKAFLALWFGDRPVMPQLKKDLLQMAQKS